MGFNIILGDLKPMTGQLTASGAAFPLVELTDTLVMTYTTPEGTTKTKALTITDAALGKWTANWVDGDLPEVGHYVGQITVTRSGDASFPRSFPDDGSMILWWVYRKIGVD